jgi:hypothetical protein
MAVPLDDVPDHGAWMKMPACLLAWFKTDFPHIDRGNIDPTGSATSPPRMIA